MAQNTYVGMWVTEDGYIRHELLPNGRYDEARGNRQSTYQGRYTIEGDHIEYVDVPASRPMAISVSAFSTTAE